MLKNFPIGSNLTLINTMYSFPRKDNETGKWDKDAITVIYKDNRTGKKYHERIENPDYEFYIAKEGVDVEPNQLFIESKDAELITVPYRDLEKKIAELTDNTPFYYENIKLGNRYANKRLHTNPRLFMSDSHIEDHYRFRFNKLYTNDITPITKAYFDIEADTINMKGDFPELGECPVNAITIIDEANNKTFTLVLRNPDNPLIEEFERSINKELFVELKDFIRHTVGGWKNEIRFGLEKMEYEFLFYDDEIPLMGDLFRYINSTQPDFVLAWNMAFDIPYIIERIKKLGYRPEDIMCHPDFDKPVCKYMVDERNVHTELSERGDLATISSYSVYLDQLIHFASRRKGQSAFQSFKLDDIGRQVAKVRKTDYSHITTSIAKLPWLDFKTFIFYNIVDTIVQKCVEVKVSDIDYVFGKCTLNNTRYNKCHRQTVYLVNRGAKDFYEDGCIIGNNHNRQNEKPTEKFSGAHVACPLRLNDYSKMNVQGMPINLYNNADDYDYKSLYPSEIREFNMGPHTQIGKINIDEVIYKDENPFKNPLYSRGGAFIEDLHAKAYLEFGRRWYNFASYAELYKDVQDFYSVNMNPCFFMNNFNRNGNINITRTLVKDTKLNIIKVFEDGEKINIIDTYTPMSQDTKERILNNIDKKGVVYHEY